LSIAFEIGLSQKEYDYMTPFEFSLYVKAYNKRIKYEQDERVTQAYLTAYWQRVNKMPKLQDVLQNKQQQKNQMTDKQMFNMVKSLHAAFGGE